MDAQTMHGHIRFKLFLQEFQSETDRGCAVLCLCVLEDALKGMFRALVTKEGDVEGLCPRGQLSRITENALALGFINPDERATLLGLIKVRNKFAHGAALGRTFASPEIEALIRQVPMPIPVDRDALVGKEPLRNQFLLMVAWLHGVMIMRTQAIARRKVPEHTPNLTQEEFDQQQAEREAKRAARLAGNAAGTSPSATSETA